MLRSYSSRFLMVCNGFQGSTIHTHIHIIVLHCLFTDSHCFSLVCKGFHRFSKVLIHTYIHSSLGLPLHKAFPCGGTHGMKMLSCMGRPLPKELAMWRGHHTKSGAGGEDLFTYKLYIYIYNWLYP